MSQDNTRYEELVEKITEQARALAQRMVKEVAEAEVGLDKLEERSVEVSREFGNHLLGGLGCVKYCV